jgi:two-component system, LytTR family, response regulator
MSGPVIYLSDSKIVHVVPLDEIVYLKAQRSYCQIFLICGETITYSKPLSHISKELNHFFVRLGQSYIINRNHVRKISKKDKLLIMSGGHELNYPMNTCKLLSMLEIDIREEKTANRET